MYSKRITFTVDQLSAWIKEAYEEGWFDGYGSGRQPLTFDSRARREDWERSTAAKTLSELVAFEQKLSPVDEMAARMAPELWKNGDYANFADASADAYRFAAEMVKAREKFELPTA